MVTTFKKSGAQNWTWSGTGFVRQTPSEKRTAASIPSLQYSRARYYDPATGEFISQDPLEYVDGMSQYRAYFVPGGMDPFGFCQVGCSGNIITGGGGGKNGNGRAPRDVPWEDRDIAEGPEVPKGGQVLGFTVMRITVKCDKKCEKCPDGKFRPKNCKVYVDFHIILDEEVIKTIPGRTVKGTYGHEQRHVANQLKWLQDNARAINDAVNKLRWEDEFLCEVSGKREVSWTLIKQYLPYNNDEESTHGNGDESFVPKAGTDYDPIGAMPEKPTKCPFTPGMNTVPFEF